MIKTTSFALPRASQNSPSPKSRARQHAIKAAKARATEQPSMASLFAPPTPIPEISAAEARALIREAAPKSRAKTKAVAAPAPTPVPVAPTASASRPMPKVEPTMPSTSPAPKNTTRTPKRNEAAPVTLPALANVAPQIEVTPVTVVAPVAKKQNRTLPSHGSEQVAEVAVATPTVEKPAPKKMATEPKKSKRAKVPANLAEQYGQSLSKRVENGIEDTAGENDSPKKRLNRAERQARRELMNPNDDLMARLQRAHSIIPTAKTEKRPRGWRFDCGRCGQTSFFQTSGAICKCGALAIKE